ncbi:hypothetical protein [Negadavirga shengliensis]|uniref:Lipocalin-like domain-containing protein n=1 Tax=Negadavirga shengliensis TaxID=1389218 RepID=A0ABV9T780_9BACT
MKTRLIIFLSIILTVSLSANAQSVVGFWTVDQVKVGDKNLTPVAKWFKYHIDHTYQAGNGWTQNDIGTWEYDKEKNEFLPESKNGKDEYGPFKVSFSGEKMTWERMEDGMHVTVSLSEITEMPMSPKDSIAGSWELISVIKNDEDITTSYDPENKETILIRWTETYRKTNPDGSQSFGFWHMDAHDPEFHLIDFNREVDFQVFIISFKDNLVVMKSKKDKDMTLTYKRK